MKFLFVKSSAIGSRIIRWGLKSQSSHFAICFDEDLGVQSAIAFHSYGTRGTQLLWFEDFLEKYEVVHAVELKHKPSLESEESIYRTTIAQDRGQGYDFKALLWWVWRGALHRFFSIPIPSKNGWQQNGYALCTKLAQRPVAQSGFSPEGVDFEAIKLDELYALMLASEKFIDASEWVAKVNGVRQQ